MSAKDAESHTKENAHSAEQLKAASAALTAERSVSADLHRKLNNALHRIGSLESELRTKKLSVSNVLDEKKEMKDLADAQLKLALAKSQASETTLQEKLKLAEQTKADVDRVRQRREKAEADLQRERAAENVQERQEKAKRDEVCGACRQRWLALGR